MNINELIRKAQKGDRDAMNEILHIYSSFVKKIVRYHSIVLNREDREDLFIDGLMGLYRAVNNFDFDKGKNFDDFAYVSVKNAVLDYLRKRKEVRTVSFDFTSFTVDGGEESILLKQDLESFAKRLSLFEKDVFLLFIKGYRIRDISNKLGRSYKSVDNALQRIKKRLRKSPISS